MKMSARGMRPIGSPYHAVRRCFDDRACQRRHVGISWGLVGKEVRPDEFRPGVLPSQEAKQGLKSGRLHTVLGSHAAEMVDHEIDVQRAELFLGVRYFRELDEKLQMPPHS